MNDCNHPSYWKFVDLNCSNCFACIMEFLENDENPMTCKDRVAEELLINIDCDFEEYITNLIQNQKVVYHIIDVLMNVLFKNNQGFLKDLFLKVLLKFDQAFDDSVLDVVFCFTEKLCLPCSNYKNHQHLLSFLLNLLSAKKSFADKFILSDSFMSFIFSGIVFPEDEFRQILLDICLCMVARSVDISHPLNIFDQLPSILVKLFLNSKSQPVLKTSLKILSETAKISYFINWFNDNVLDRTDLLQEDKLYGISQMFASIKRIVLMHQDELNLPVMQTIKLLLEHEALIQPFLDSDLAELIYDSLCCTSDNQLILAIYNIISLLSRNEEFFVSCHAMYGIKPVCSSLSLLLLNKALPLACIGFEVLQVLCDKHASDASILPTSNLFDLFLQAVTDGIKSGNIVVASHAISTSCSLLKHLPYPLPCKDLTALCCTIKDYISKDISKVASSSQFNNEEMLNSAETALSSVLEFTEKCIRISSYAINAVDNPDVEEFTDFLLDSFLKIWMPIIKLEEKTLWSSAVMENCFRCLKALLGSQNTFSLDLWKHTIAEGFLEDALKLKSNNYDDDENLLNDVINDFLLEMSLPLLHLLNFSKVVQMLKNGYVLLTGNLCEIVHYLKQCAVTSSGEIDQSLLDLQCSVLTLLALSTWQINSFCSVQELHNILNVHETLHDDMDNLPLILLKLKFFLYCICQQDFYPEFPRGLIERLKQNDNLIIVHPAVLSAALRCSDDVIEKEIKIEFIFSWVDQIDITHFLSLSDSKHLVGLSLMHDQVASIVLTALSSASDNPSRFNKLVLIIASAVDESVDEESNFNYDEETKRFHELVAQRLPDIVDLDYDHVVKAPNLVSVSLFRLLHTLARKTFHSNHVVLHRPRILRKIILLLVNNWKTSSHDLLDDEVVTLLLDNIHAILDRNDNPQSIAAALFLSECLLEELAGVILKLSLIFSNTELLKNIERLLTRPTENFRLCNVHFSAFQLLSTLVRFEKDSNSNIEYCIKFKAEDLLELVQNSFDQNLQISVLNLWRSLFEIKFNSSLFKLEPGLVVQNQFFTKDQVLFAPLNRTFIFKLFLFTLNCSAKGFPGIRSASLRCLLAILTFTQSTSVDLFTELASSPWLRFALDPIQSENSIDEELRAALFNVIKLCDVSQN